MPIPIALWKTLWEIQAADVGDPSVKPTVAAKPSSQIADYLSDNASI